MAVPPFFSIFVGKAIARKKRPTTGASMRATGAEANGRIKVFPRAISRERAHGTPSSDRVSHVGGRERAPLRAARGQGRPQGDRALVQQNHGKDTAVSTFSARRSKTDQRREGGKALNTYLPTTSGRATCIYNRLDRQPSLWDAQHSASPIEKGQNGGGTAGLQHDPKKNTQFVLPCRAPRGGGKKGQSLSHSQSECGRKRRGKAAVTTLSRRTKRGMTSKKDCPLQPQPTLSKGEKRKKPARTSSSPSP